MARLSDLDPAVAAALLNLPLPTFSAQPWVTPAPNASARVAIVTTAGIHRRDDAKFQFGSGEFRVLPGDVEPEDLAMSHVSVNFDRSGFIEDVNVVFPLALLRDLVQSGEIGSVATWHYSFMGATDPSRMEATGREVARLLRADGVTVALLVPI